MKWMLLFVIGCAAEPIGPSPCEQATSTLERCTGAVPEGFAEACARSPDEISAGVLAEADGETCGNLGKADGLAEDLFVDGCSALVNAAYWVVWARSPASQPLSPAMRAKLRPWFGDLVDTVKVSWNSGLLTHWRVFGRDIVFDDDTLAQTFGNEIFVRELVGTENQQIALIGHELGHVRQYRKYGGVIGFARQYCTAFYESNYSYRNNALEVQAYDLQHQIAKCLDYGQGCP